MTRFWNDLCVVAIYIDRDIVLRHIRYHFRRIGWHIHRSSTKNPIRIDKTHKEGS
jgi:hypothetical protein